LSLLLRPFDDLVASDDSHVPGSGGLCRPSCQQGGRRGT